MVRKIEEIERAERGLQFAGDVERVFGPDPEGDERSCFAKNCMANYGIEMAPSPLIVHLTAFIPS